MFGASIVSKTGRIVKTYPHRTSMETIVAPDRQLQSGRHRGIHLHLRNWSLQGECEVKVKNILKNPPKRPRIGGMKDERGMFQTPPQSSEIAKILRREHAGAISEQELASLIPDAVRRAAKNPDQLQIRQLAQEPGEFGFFIIEKNFPYTLTYPDEYAYWKQEIQRAREDQAHKKVRVLPPAPNGVNKLHAKFSDYIDRGDLSFSDRILMTCRLKLYPDNPQALYIVDYDGETGAGIGQDFYKNVLPEFCRRNGLRFIAGQNRVHNISFFLKTLGRYSNEDLKPEYRKTFFPEGSLDSLFTIQFLYPEDVEKYIDPKSRK